MSATPMIPTASLKDRQRIAVEKGPTFNPGNKAGVFSSTSNNGCGCPFDHAAIAERRRQYVHESFIVGAPRIGFLLASEDHAEMLDASHELACGHLPLDGCRCKPKRKGH